MPCPNKMEKARLAEVRWLTLRPNSADAPLPRAIRVNRETERGKFVRVYRGILNRAG